MNGTRSGPSAHWSEAAGLVPVNGIAHRRYPFVPQALTRRRPRQQEEELVL